MAELRNEHAARFPTAPLAASGPVRVVERRRGPVGQTAVDVGESFARVVRKTQMPSREGVLGFFGNQVLVNAVAWTAGVLAATLVRNFFEVKGFRNLWGLVSSRNVVSADDYRLIVTLASYSAGLSMLILMRHLVLRLVAEFRSLRVERAQGDPGGPWLAAAPDDDDADLPEADEGPLAEASRSRGRRAAAGGGTAIEGLEQLADDWLGD